MLELEEKVNKAAKECCDRLRNNRKWPGQDITTAAFIEGVKWLARESMKELGNDRTNMGTVQRSTQIKK